MVNNTLPLQVYKEPFYYTGIITLIALALFIYSIIYINIVPNLVVPSLVIALIFGIATYFLWSTRCPYCKRPFSKTENTEWKEDLGIKKEPYSYYSKVYRYSDGTTENVPGSEKTILRDRRFEMHYYVCNKCGYGSDKEWKEEKGEWLGDAPKPKYIKKEGNAIGLNFDQRTESNKKDRVPINTSLKRELFERAGNACQHCGQTFALDIHHIDGNPANNSKTNLIVLCATCHRLVGGISKIALKNEAIKAYRKSKTINIYK
jgi:DNA-directed RNA polymerase subunit RPC12/RpoP